MTFEQKLNIIMNEIISVYGLSNSQANIIRQNIVSRVNMYQSVNPNFNNAETKIIASNNEIGDFFINRLVTNIRNYDFDQTYNKENTLKGAYTFQEQSIYIGNHKFIKDITRDKLKATMPVVDDETLKKSNFKCIQS